MNKQEAVKLLALIKVAYPAAYRDMDEASKKATVNMWQMSFPDVPYPIMEQAFGHFRMVSRFPPTVAEMVQELKQIHQEAVEGALLHRELGNQEAVKQYRLVMAYTARYKDDTHLGGLNIGCLQGRIGGEYDGASRDRLDRGDGVPVLAAGQWGAGGDG